MEHGFARPPQRVRTLAPRAGPTGGAGLALPAGSASLIMPVTAWQHGTLLERVPASRLGKEGHASAAPTSASQPRTFPTAGSPLAAMVATRRWAVPLLLLLASSAARWPAHCCCRPPRKALPRDGRLLLLRCCC